ncbi:MAG: T9SS type A sorting domain-containing protein [Bacteroidetes bacterium]|jgi:hypothetical protein|nr:T9SS type A sorting domain-containing protein [Bacteroidota bacterium]MBK7569117.1 T9SS type A sorting domain-containing protein [Bacteroidota bacterium]MBP8915219.1 T9SS type A sorting domain-containing protein [Chitinophagales bacterium]MBP9794905.1 T9SS type A sorting domain-containing protein [Chitinophagales bacterium]
MKPELTQTRLIFILFTLCFILKTQYCFSQDPIVDWENTIGGGSSDFLMASAETLDGGFIIAGYSYSSIGFDKTESAMNYDYWVVKLNASGTIVWQNTIGTALADYLTSIIATPDGGYLVGGYTTGGISGDKTDPAIGLKDYWILKLAPTGDIVWQKTIGGSGDDFLTDMISITGGGFILSGYSNSGISGNKTEACIGGYDYWIIKINSVGVIQWQYTIGGSGNDYLKETIRSSDGNFVLAGYSISGISGDKTEANIGGNDYWVLAIDGSGTVVWQNTIGGTGYDYLNSISELNTGGFILGGNSSSNISGDKSENSLNYLDYCWGCGYFTSGNGNDYWIVRIDNVGNLIWENSFLTGSEWSSAEVDEVFQYDDNKIMIAGNSEGNGDNLETDGGNDYWLLAIDTNGYIIWQEVLGGEITWEYDEYEWIVENGDSYLRSCFVTSDGGFFVAGSSNGMLGNDKSESVLGGYNQDYWVLKLGPDTCTPFPVYSDYDRDGEGSEFISSACELTYGPWVSNSNDCNDLYSSVNTMAVEICDGLDNDCNGTIDEGFVDCNSGPIILWDKTLGDAAYNQLSEITSTNDGGTISIGSKTEVSPETDSYYDPEFNYNIEINKLDAGGNIQWQKIITADQDDKGISVKQMPDNGFIIGATSFSGISGDKSVAGFGSSDYWIIKLNSLGDIEWQKVFGGSNYDNLTDVEITSDGGFVISGHSNSGISGNKSESTNGVYDFWILKLNALGEIEWQNGIGGAGNDYDPYVGVDSSGNYYVGGKSLSGISGDKTETNLGSYDFWALKLNVFGAIIWQNTIGGLLTEDIFSVDVDDAGNMILAGNSNSGISFDKTEPSADYDYWIVKLNSDGSIDWDNTISGVGFDYCRSVAICPDGGYLVGGYSVSVITSDKNESYHLTMFSPYGLSFEEKSDYWILKLDNEGNTIWQNTMGGNMGDYLMSIAIGDDEKIMLGGYSKSGHSGDKSGECFGIIQEVIEIDEYYEDQWTHYYPNTDFWILQLEPEGCILMMEICNTIDDNCNGLIDDAVIETINISAGGPIIFCQGGSVLLTATYSGATVQWKKNGTNIAGATSSTYSVTKTGDYTCVTTSPCGTATSSLIHVIVNKNPAASITAGGATTFCAGGSVTLMEVPVTGCSYQWYKGASTIAGATSTNYIATTAGNYKCRVTKTASGCFKNSNTIVVTVPCKEGEELLAENNNFTIFPNPNTGTFNLVYNVPTGGISPLEPADQFGAGGPRGVTMLEIFNSLGQQIHSQQINSPDGNINETISVNNLSSGIYFVRLGNGTIYSQQKLIIE